MDLTVPNSSKSFRSSSWPVPKGMLLMHRRGDVRGVRTQPSGER